MQACGTAATALIFISLKYVLVLFAELLLLLQASPYLWLVAIASKISKSNTIIKKTKFLIVISNIKVEN